MLRAALLASGLAVFAGTMAPPAIAAPPPYLTHLRQLELEPVMPPVPYGFSVGAPHIPQIPVDVYGEPQWLEAGATAFERAEYATALDCFQKAGPTSALGHFDAGLAALYLGDGSGVVQMKTGLALARKQGFVELVDRMQSVLDKVDALHLIFRAKR
jgi:hypothetical protein